MKLITLFTTVMSVGVFANPQVNVGDIIDPSICQGQGYKLERKSEESWGNTLVKNSMFDRTYKLVCKDSDKIYVVRPDEIAENGYLTGYISGYKVHSIMQKNSLFELHFGNMSNFVQYRDGAARITRHQVFFPVASNSCAQDQAALAYSAIGQKIHGAHTSAYREEYIDYGVTTTSVCLDLNGISSAGWRDNLVVLDELTDGYDTYALLYKHDGHDYDPGASRDELIVIKMDRAHPTPVITLEQKLTAEVTRLYREIGGCHYENNFATGKLLSKDKVLLKFGGVYGDSELVTLDYSDPNNIVQKDINRIGNGSPGGICLSVGIGGARAEEVPYFRDSENGLYRNNNGELVYRKDGQEIKVD